MGFTQRWMYWACLIALAAACKKDKQTTGTPVATPAEDYATVVFDFKAFANNRLMWPDTAWFSNAVGDSFTVSEFNYFVTNIRLIRNDGYVLSEQESYHIIRHVEGMTTLTVSGVPEATYTGIEFLLGVDSVRNSSGAQTGALDIGANSQGMFWTWNIGYVFFKLEGYFRSSGFTMPTQYAMHIGTTPNLKKCTFSIANTPLIAQKKKRSVVHYNVNIDEVFSHPINLDMNTYHGVTGGKQAEVIADNYKDMFSISGVENQ